jgi:hypothetical protein
MWDKDEGAASLRSWGIVVSPGDAFLLYSLTDLIDPRLPVSNETFERGTRPGGGSRRRDIERRAGDDVGKVGGQGRREVQ